MLSYLTDLLRKRRTYARFSEWPMDKHQREAEVVSRLFTSLSAQGDCPYQHPRPFVPDPPDIIADNPRGGICGIEVTELVDAHLATFREHQDGPPREWHRSELPATIAEILERKDRKPFNGGPHSDRLVCMFTGEPLLTVTEAKRELEAARFGPFRQLTGAYLVFPFDPALGVCPIIELRIVT